MQVLTKGHKYLLGNVENPTSQTIQFIEKDLVNGDFKTINDGTTNEDVLEMLIDRLKYLQQANSCRENAIVITKLEESLMWLQKRTADRKSRGVEGTPNI